MIVLDTSSRTTSMNLYYVAISRAKQEARIYTNSVANLPDAISRRFDKTTALAIQQERVIQGRELGLYRAKYMDRMASLKPKSMEQKQVNATSSARSKRDFGEMGKV